MTTHLIKIRLQKMHLSLLLQQSRPVLLIQLLLLHDQLNISWRMIDFRTRWVDVGVEFELDGICAFLRFAVALEVEVGGLDIEFDLVFLHVWYRDGEEDVVFFVLG